MSLVRVENVTKTYSGDYVLRNVSFRVEDGEKIGLIGRNGTGKSTLFHLILGDVEPEGGIIERMRRAKIAHLAQMPRFDSPESIYDIVMQLFKDLVEMERELSRMEDQMSEGDTSILDQYTSFQEQFALSGGYEFRAQVKRVLFGLGFSEDDFKLPVKALSGGQRTRLMLALVLLQDADLLLLDEPENHLDLEAREWLEGYLRDCAKSVVIISHDRRMLNAVSTRVVEVERSELRSHTGNYDEFTRWKALIREQQEKEYALQQEFIEKEESWINRFRYKNTKAVQVQSRIKRLEKLERIDAPPPESATVKFDLGEVVRSGQVVLEAADLGMAYGPLHLYSQLSFKLERGERIGIIGPNGSGKTTLLRHLASRLSEADTATYRGTVTVGHKVRLGFYDQHHESMNSSNTMLAEVQSVRPDLIPEKIRTFLGRFLFSGDDVFKTISSLSGGELSRVAMAKLILSNVNVLLLDEPTNHLDIASREALEESLASFPGSIIMVSHDRALIDKLVDKLIIIEHGTGSVHLGNYTDYRWRLDNERAKQALPESVTKASAVRGLKGTNNSKGISAKNTAQIPAKSKKKDTPLNSAEEKERRKQKKLFEEMEKTIAQMEIQISELENSFTQIDPSDFTTAAEMKREYDTLQAELNEKYAAWETMAESLGG